MAEKKEEPKKKKPSRLARLYVKYPKLKLDPLRCPQPKPLTPAQKAMRDSLKPATDAAGKPCLREFTPDGKLKTDGVTVYSDIAPDDNSLDYTKEGLKCKRTFLVDGLTITGTNGCGTLYALKVSGAVPQRGDAHPYITNTLLGLPAGINFAADVVHIEPHTSIQAKVTVDYAILNGATQEPSTDNNANPALLTIASSAQTTQTNIALVTDGDDQNPTPIICTYPAPGGAGGYNIQDIPSHYVYVSPQDTNHPNGGMPTSAISFGTAQKQVPNAVIRFVRRETQPDDGLLYLYCTNNAEFNIPGMSEPYDAGSLLCTRVENETDDGGVSYIVTREFQENDGTPEQAASGTPGTPTYQPYIPAQKGWEVGCFFTVQNGAAAVVTSSTVNPGTQVAQAGQIPPDASANVFQIYEETDFSVLNLTP